MRKRISGIASGLFARQPNYVFYLLSFLRGLPYGFIGAVYALLLFSKGLNPLQVNLVNLVFLATLFLFQIPTGALADSWGRKPVFILGLITQSISFFFYAFGSGWPWFVAGEFISGIGFALMSGSLDAWVVDRYQQINLGGRTDFLFSRSEVSLNLANLIGALSTTYLVRFGLQFPFLVGGIVFLAAIAASAILIEEKPIISARASGTRGFKKIIQVGKDGINLGVTNSILGFLLIYSFLMGLGLKSLDLFWSKRFADMANVQTVTRIWVLISLSLIIGSHLVKKWADQGKSQLRGLVITTIGISVFIFISAVSGLFIPAVTSFVFYEVFRGTFRPLQLASINTYASSHVRATMISFVAMVMVLGGMIGLVASGWVATKFSIPIAWIAASGVIGLSCIPLAKCLERGAKA